VQTSGSTWSEGRVHAGAVEDGLPAVEVHELLERAVGGEQVEVGVPLEEISRGGQGDDEAGAHLGSGHAAGEPGAHAAGRTKRAGERLLDRGAPGFHGRGHARRGRTSKSVTTTA
jgi:hypothetical protein